MVKPPPCMSAAANFLSRAFALIVVGLIDYQQHGRLDATQPDCDLLVVVGDANRTVDEEHHQRGASHGGLDLATDLVIEFAARRQPSAGVDQLKWSAEPLGVDLFAVASHARAVFDNGNLLADYTVKQGALAHVWTANNHHTW